MQRSRRALLQRRAISEKDKKIEKKQLYKVSLSVIIILWIIVFLLNSLISHGNGYRDGSSLQEDDLSTNEPDTIFKSNDENTPTVEGETCNNDENTLTLPIEHEQEIYTEQVTGSQKDEIVTGDSSQRADRISRITPLGLDEFKSKAINPKGKTVNSQTGTVIHRVEPGGKEYNYASSSKGAKVLSFNKEAKGTSNVLDKDKDKYLRNPCSVEGKFIIIELSEETLVNTIEIANFEHYSSNLKDFEVYCSLVYPTENWDKIGNFTAINAKHAQRFSLLEPKWARYLKFNFVNHYGSEFYCTLSSIEVYGVDAVERMLEDLISDEKKKLENPEDLIETIPSQESVERNDSNFEELDFEQERENGSDKRIVPDPVTETSNTNRALQVGRVPGDTVLKVLMQKVQGLDLNFSVLERYLEELNSRYGQIFKDFDVDMGNKEKILERIKLEIKGLQESKENFINEIGEILSWKLIASSQMDKVIRDNELLRSEMEGVKERQAEIENRGLAVIFISILFGFLAISKLFLGFILRVCRLPGYEKFCRENNVWLLLLLSSSIVAFIMAI